MSVVLEDGVAAEPHLLGRGDLEEHVFLGIEVVVEGPVREAGGGGDVGDPGLEEALLLEHLLGRGDDPGARALALAGAGARDLVDVDGGRRGHGRSFRSSRDVGPRESTGWTGSAPGHPIYSRE